MGEINVYTVLLGKPEGNLGIDERIILKWIFEKQDLKVN
jgi:hypothetical protein